jgi:hypothetical protein
MEKAKVEKKTRVSKKALLRKLAEKTGRPLFHFDSLGRSNVETIRRDNPMGSRVGRRTVVRYPPPSRLNLNLGKAVNIPPPCKALCGG